MAKKKNRTSVQARIQCYMEWLHWIKNRRK